MRSVNKVILIGNLTRDPEMRQTPNGQQVCTFGIATNRQWVAKDGSKHNSAEFHELVAWAKLAEICGNYLKKGKLIYIEGYLKTRIWDTPEGIRRHKTEVIVQDMIMLEKRGDDTGDLAPKNSEDLSAPVEKPAEAGIENESSAEPTPTPEDDGIEF
jgi:single-strand DNA-binding protein